MSANLNCPYCGISYLHGGNYTFAMTQGKLSLECPSCKRLSPDNYVEKLKEKSNSNKKCYIATACYGDYNAPEVLVFREFRDKYLLKNQVGIYFVKFYYKYSPYWANKLKNHLLINKLVKKFILDFIYNFLK